MAHRSPVAARPLPAASAAGARPVIERLWRRVRDAVEQVLFGQAMRAMDTRDVQAYYRTTNG